MMITLSASGGPPTDQVRDEIRGLITTGQLAAGERLPSVRQLATDLDVAPGTIAKAYEDWRRRDPGDPHRQRNTRRDGSIPHRSLRRRSRPETRRRRRRQGVDLDEATRVLRAIW